MTYQDVIEYFGGTQVATVAGLKKLGITRVSQPAVSMWKERGAVPPLVQLQLEIATKGALIADPGIYPEPLSVSQK